VWFVTQEFNTTTSMGRLTLIVLFSFAQFEREVTPERIRDKFAAAKRKGVWMDGTPPMGYAPFERTPRIDLEVAPRVRKIFGLSLNYGCVSKLKAELDRRDWKTVMRIRASWPVGYHHLAAATYNETQKSDLHRQDRP